MAGSVLRWYCTARHVAPVKMRPHVGSKIVAARPKLRMVAQGFKFFFDPPDKRVRLFRGGLDDKGPDFGKIVFGLIGYEKGERSDLCKGLFSNFMM